MTVDAVFLRRPTSCDNGSRDGEGVGSAFDDAGSPSADSINPIAGFDAAADPTPNPECKADSDCAGKLTGQCVKSICGDEGLCESEAKTPGTSCDDQDECTSDDACTECDPNMDPACDPHAATFCRGTPPDCSDDNICTIDVYLPVECICLNYSVEQGKTILCDDGNVCTVNDKCDSTTGTCIGTMPPPPPSNNACQVFICEPAEGWVAIPPFPCDDFIRHRERRRERRPRPFPCQPPPSQFVSSETPRRSAQERPVGSQAGPQGRVDGRRRIVSTNRAYVHGSIGERLGHGQFAPDEAPKAP